MPALRSGSGHLFYLRQYNVNPYSHDYFVPVYILDQKAREFPPWHTAIYSHRPQIDQCPATCANRRI